MAADFKASATSVLVSVGGHGVLQCSVDDSSGSGELAVQGRIAAPADEPSDWLIGANRDGALFRIKDKSVMPPFDAAVGAGASGSVTSGGDVTRNGRYASAQEFRARSVCLHEARCKLCSSRSTSKRL